MPTTPQPIRLRSDNNMTDLPAVASLVFGELVKLATPTLAAYHSDLYHDALWLGRYLTGTELVFWYAFNESGTTIGTVERAVKHSHRANVYRITVRLDAGRATLTAERAA